MNKRLFSVIAILAAAAATGCAGNKSAKLLLAEMERTAPLVREDVQAMKKERALLISFAKQYVDANEIIANIPTNICERRIAEARAELATSRADIASEFIRQSASASAQIDDMIVARAEEVGVTERLGELKAERDRRRATAKAAPNDTSARLQRFAAEAVYNEYGARSTALSLEAVETASAAINATASGSLTRLDRIVALKTTELDQAYENCRAEQSSALISLARPSEFKAIEESEAFDSLSAYVGFVGDASSALLRQRNFSRTAFELAVFNALNGLKDGALKLKNEEKLSGDELKRRGAEALSAIADNGATIEEIKETVSVNGLKNAAGLSNIGGAITGAATAKISELLSPSTRGDLEEDAQAAAANELNEREGDSQ